MIFTPDYTFPEIDDKDLVIERVKKSNKIYCNLYLTHYPGSRGIMGRQLHYVLWFQGSVAGIIGANSPPLNYKLFQRYFGDSFSELNWMNNNVFRLTQHEKNLGTKVLKMFRGRVKEDYKDLYGDNLVGLVTFVEPPRGGSVYRADNWDFLGYTQGKSCRKRDFTNWQNKEWSSGSIKKLIFARML